MRFLLTMALLFLVGCGGDTEDQQAPDQQAPTVDLGPETAFAPFDPMTVDVSVDEPTNAQPVAFGAALDRDTAAPGETLTLVVRANVAEPWHIYSADGPTGVGRPTSFELTLPEGVSADSEWTNPEATVKESALGPIASYHGDIRFSVPVNVSDTAALGEQQIQCKINFQSCTDQQCLPPTSTLLTIPVSITR